MAKFLITGGKPLQGTVQVGGAKNSSFKLMIAALLCQGESRLRAVPQIGDVAITSQIIKALGGQLKKYGSDEIGVAPTKLKTFSVPQKFGFQSRASILFAGPLLARFGRAVLPVPGGDKVGLRPVERHLAGLQALGAKVKIKDGLIELRCASLKGSCYRFVKNTHTGTETMIMAAVKAKGKTKLSNVALEPEIDDLVKFFNQAGAKIKRLPNRQIIIEGVKNLAGHPFQVMPDRNEVVSYACAALGTKGKVTIKNVSPKYLKAFLTKVKKAGGRFKAEGANLCFWYQKPLQAVSVTTRPYPGFMSDWQPLWATLMTQARGETKIIESVHNYRFGYTQALGKMGARIELFNPQVKNPQAFYNFNLEDDRPENFHAAKIKGPTFLQGQSLTVPDVRAGATLVLAALMASGQSVLAGIEHIDRGYEKLDEKLKELGAVIKRVS